MPALFYFLFSACLLILMGRAPAGFLWTLCMAFLAIVIPSAAFVTAFSLVLSLFMPLRVYQILFVGYWFWGNYLNANVIPTLNGTLLTTSGLHAYIGYFGGYPGVEGPLLFSPIDATLNLLVLGVAVVFALMAAIHSLNRTARTL
jgi:hypothetical protein